MRSGPLPPRGQPSGSLIGFAFLTFGVAGVVLQGAHHVWELVRWHVSGRVR